MIITPALAKAMLTKNTANRPVSQNHVLNLAREMSMGKWVSNAEPIRLGYDEHGNERVIDGQHRLHSVVLSGVSIRALVVTGLSADVFSTIDIGVRRSAGETLAALGEKNPRELAATLAIVERYNTGRIAAQQKYSNREVVDMLDKYPGVRNSVELCDKTKKLLPRSVLAGCHFIFSLQDKDAADLMVSKLLSGSGLNEKEPVFMLRERLVQNSMSKTKLSYPYIMALVIKTWNAQRRGTPLRLLIWRETGFASEEFPVAA